MEPTRSPEVAPAAEDPSAALLGDGRPSFALWDALCALTGARLRAAAEAHAAALARVEPALRLELEAEQEAHAAESVAWLARYNRSLRGRIAGYLALGRRLDFAYPWPIVAVLGISRVEDGMVRNHAWGLAASVLERLGADTPARVLDAAEDSLRRTNRAIFADSVPTVLYALRCDALRAGGRATLAEALLDGPLPASLDAECRALARELYDALALAPGTARFERLAALTLRHFGREQAVFTHHMVGARSRREVRGFGRRLVMPAAVVAPRLQPTRSGGRRLVFRPFALPPGFDFRDHDARVAHFGRAFVTSLTADPEDYRAAVAWTLRRFERGAARALPAGPGADPRAR